MSRFYSPENTLYKPSCRVCAAVDESYTIAQWLARLPGKQKVPGSNPGGAA